MRLNWANRQSPGEFDVSAPEEVSYEFDHTRGTVPGTPSWPEKFGPSTIKKAWKAGLVVVAQIEGFPYPIAVSEGRWTEHNKVLTVVTQEGLMIPDRIWTRKIDEKDGLRLTSSGLLIESEG